MKRVKNPLITLELLWQKIRSYGLTSWKKYSNKFIKIIWNDFNLPDCHRFVNPIVGKYTHTHTHTHTVKFMTHIHSRTHTHTHTRTHAQTHRDSHTHTHTHAHTHTPLLYHGTPWRVAAHSRYIRSCSTTTALYKMSIDVNDTQRWQHIHTRTWK